MLRDGDPVAEHNSWYVNPCWGVWVGGGPCRVGRGGLEDRGTRVGESFSRSRERTRAHRGRQQWREPLRTQLRQQSRERVWGWKTSMQLHGRRRLRAGSQMHSAVGWWVVHRVGCEL